MILSSLASQSVASTILSLHTLRGGSARVPGSPHAASLMFFRTRVVCAPEQNTSYALRVHRTQHTSPLTHLNHLKPPAAQGLVRRRSANRRSGHKRPRTTSSLSLIELLNLPLRSSPYEMSGKPPFKRASSAQPQSPCLPAFILAVPCACSLITHQPLVPQYHSCFP
jgi:hypothetical protein